MRISLISHTKSECDLYLYIRNILIQPLKPGFQYKITLCACERERERERKERESERMREGERDKVREMV